MIGVRGARYQRALILAKDRSSADFGVGGVSVPRPARRQLTGVQLLNEALKIGMVPRLRRWRFGVAFDGIRHDPILSRVANFHPIAPDRDREDATHLDDKRGLEENLFRILCNFLENSRIGRSCDEQSRPKSTFVGIIPRSVDSDS